MLEFLAAKLLFFRGCFSRAKTFANFVVVILGFLTRRSQRGVTGFVDALNLDEKRYEDLLNFFRSTAYKVKDLRNVWTHIVASSEDKHLCRINGKVVLAGDGTKQHKEALKMPGVKIQHQESEDGSKREWAFGHLLGSIGVIASDEEQKQTFCIPLSLSIQDGLETLADWSPSEYADYAESHVIQVVNDAYDAAKAFDSAYISLDRYFLSVPGLKALNLLNSSGDHQCLDIVTRAKNNCIAFEDPPERLSGQRGRPPKKGDSVKLYTLFSSAADEFITVTINMYGKDEEVRYLCRDLLWGKKLYQKLRFVLVESSQGKTIFACTDLTLDPVSIIKIYALRFNIEATFYSLKHSIGGLLYHFWSYSMPKLSHRLAKAAQSKKKKSKKKKKKKKNNKNSKASNNRKKSEKQPSLLDRVTDPHDRELIMKTVNAMQSFCQCACIALGLAQMIALRPRFHKQVKHDRYMRTWKEGAISAEAVALYLQRNIFWLLPKHDDLYITRIIVSQQKPDYVADDEETAA